MVFVTILYSHYCDAYRNLCMGCSIHRNGQKLNKQSALTVMYQCRCPGLIFYYDYKISPPGELAKGHMSLLMAKESPIHV